jgi:hypothetical protein
MVRGAVVRHDEAKSFGIVEKLHFAFLSLVHVAVSFFV